MEEAIRIDPQDGEVYYFRGLVYNVLGKYEEAEQVFQKAKELGYEAPGSYNA